MRNEDFLGGLIDGQIEACEQWPEGFVAYNRRYVYAALNWCVEMYSQLIDMLRTAEKSAGLKPLDPNKSGG